MKRVKFYESTHCLILEDVNHDTDESVYIVCQFINGYECENNMTLTQLEEEAKRFARKNNVTEYWLDLTEFKNIIERRKQKYAVQNYQLG